MCNQSMTPNCTLKPIHKNIKLMLSLRFDFILTNCINNPSSSNQNNLNMSQNTWRFLQHVMPFVNNNLRQRYLGID